MAAHSFEPCAYISVTSHCNNDCVFCGLKDYGIDYLVPLSEIREQLAVFLERGVRRIIFTGGEPTLHPDFVEIIRAARDAGFTNIGFFTNARRIKNAAYIAELKDAGLNAVMASLHGRTAEAHDATVKCQGAYAQTVNGLKVLSDSGVRLVVNTPVSSLNVGEITAMFDFVSDLGPSVHRWQLSNIFPTSVVMSNPGLQPDYAVAREAVFEVMNRALSGHLRCVTQEFPLCVIFPWLNESRDLSDERTQMICRKDVRGDYRRYKPWTSPYKTKLASCGPCGMRSVCAGVPLCYLMSHRDLSIFRPLEYLTPESWRRQMGIAD